MRCTGKLKSVGVLLRRGSCVLVFVLLTGATSAADLRVCVSDSSGDPVPGATVVITGTLYGSITDAAGCAQLVGVPAGTHPLLIQRDGFRPFSREVTVRSDGPNTVSVVLRRVESDAEPANAADAPQHPLQILGVASISTMSDGIVAVGTQERLGSYAAGTRFSVTTRSRRLIDRLVQASVTDRADEAFVEGGIATNTFSPSLRAAHTKTREGDDFDSAHHVAIDVQSGNSYEDGDGDEVVTAYDAGSMRIGVARIGERATSQLMLDGVFETNAVMPSGISPTDAAHDVVATARFDRHAAVGAPGLAVHVSAASTRESWKSVERFSGVTGVRTSGVYRRQASTVTGEFTMRAGETTWTASVGLSVELQTQTPVQEVGVADPYRVRDAGLVGGLSLRHDIGPVLVETSTRASLLGVRLQNSGQPTSTKSLVLPSAAVKLSFGGPSRGGRYEIHHNQWLPAYEVRLGRAEVFWFGQQVAAARVESMARSRATSQRLSLFATRGDVRLSGSAGLEFLHDVPGVFRSAAADSGFIVKSDAGLAYAFSFGAEWSPLGLVSVGATGHYLRSESTRKDESMTATPGGAIGAYLHAAPLGEYPFIRWETNVLLPTASPALSVGERDTGAASHSNFSLGARIRMLAFTLSIHNISDRTYRTHLTPRTWSPDDAGETVYLPGRRFSLAVRLDAR